MAQSQQVAGKAAVGGPFELIDYNGKPFSDKWVRVHVCACVRVSFLMLACPAM